MCCKLHFPFTAGSSIFHVGNDRVMRKILHGLLGVYAFYGRDIRGWDGSVTEELQTSVCTVVLNCVDCEIPVPTAMLRAALVYLIMALSRCLILLPWDEAAFTTQGLKSGFYLTNFLGSAIHYVIFCASFFWIMSKMNSAELEALRRDTNVISPDQVVDMAALSITSDIQRDPVIYCLRHAGKFSLFKNQSCVANGCKETMQGDDGITTVSANICDMSMVYMMDD